MPKFEIIYDPRDPLLTLYTAFQPGRHVLMQSDYAAWANRMTGKKSLFVYRHARSYNYVLAAWTWKPPEPCGGGGIMQELVCMPGSPENCPVRRPTREGLLAMAEPLEEAWKRRQRSARALVRQEHSLAVEEDETKRSLARSLKRSGLELEAHLVSSGAMPIVSDTEGGEELEEMRADLTAPEKIINVG
jgi:hypothetical protein